MGEEKEIGGYHLFRIQNKAGNTDRDSIRVGPSQTTRRYLGVIHDIRSWGWALFLLRPPWGQNDLHRASEHCVHGPLWVFRVLRNQASLALQPWTQQRTWHRLSPAFTESSSFLPARATDVLASVILTWNRAYCCIAMLYPMYKHKHMLCLKTNKCLQNLVHRDNWDSTEKQQDYNLESPGEPTSTH